jgi:HEAT repeat protein
MVAPGTAAVRRQLTQIENGRTDSERARRVAVLKKLPPATRVAAILEAAHGSPALRRIAALAIAKVGGAGATEALAALLGDSDPITRAHAAQAIGSRPELARTCVPELERFVRLELPRARKPRGGLRDGLSALGAAQTKQALGVLLAISTDSFAVPAFRSSWLEALARYRSPRVKRVLEAHRSSSDPKERVPAIVGLLRNGRDASLRELRDALDDSDFFVARDAARHAHEALGTKFVFNPKQLASLKKWWDAAPGDLDERVAALRAT